MLQIVVPETELWDEEKQEFRSVKGQTLQLEHSLISVSKWESKWHKAFYSMKEKTYEEVLDYVRCMTLTQNVNPEVYACLTGESIDRIAEYIDDSMTATVFFDDKAGRMNRETMTAELIYCSMIMLNIPFECQKWHINRLLTLIRVCEMKSRPPKKMNKREIMSRNAAINAARRKRLNTKG